MSLRVFAPAIIDLQEIKQEYCKQQKQNLLNGIFYQLIMQIRNPQQCNQENWESSLTNASNCCYHGWKSVAKKTAVTGVAFERTKEAK